MPIPETQLDTWAKQGSITQSQSTYASVRTCLESSDAPYAGRSKSILLQGSYGNDTNIYADSDVDVVIATDSIYYHGSDDLTESERQAFNAAHTGGASYSYYQFKKEVFEHLKTKFGSSVKPGKKAIFIKGNENRRDADVLPAVEYRRYTKYRSYTDSTFETGITFWTANGVQIINYPKQHSSNATAKHKRTQGWFKPVVRILKNMRNTMILKGYLADGAAPSYFLEGLLYNVPDSLFGESFESTFVKAINWIIECEKAKLICANEQYYLLHPTSPVTWRAEQLESYLHAATNCWNDW